TSLASWAPRFSSGSVSSTSRATVTPSFVIVGAPHFLSITTLRPLGPSVTRTALASRSTPRSRARRALSSYSRLLAMQHLSDKRDDDHPGSGPAPGLRGDRAGAGPCRARAARGARLLVDDGEHVAGREHQVLLARVLDL